MDFAEHCRTQSERCEDYVSKIVFSEECTFRFNGTVNRQNVRIWGTECSHVVNHVPRHGEKVTVWCAVSKDRVTGPYFFDEEAVTGEYYRNMLQSYALPRLNRLRFPYIFQRDGAPPHFTIQTRSILNNNRSNRWIGRGSEIGWPLYSPNLTPCDFFLWVHVKSMVYTSPITSIQELKSRITSAIRSIDRNMLRNVWEIQQLD